MGRRIASFYAVRSLSVLLPPEYPTFRYPFGPLGKDIDREVLLQAAQETYITLF